MSEIEFAGVSANLCPFCGGNNLAWETVEHNQMLMWSVVCRGADCFAQGPIDLGKSGAISKWNVLDVLLAENERLTKAARKAWKLLDYSAIYVPGNKIDKWLTTYADLNGE